jgi:hypothetical protein
MPDWTYRTVFRPVLFRVPTTVGRDLALAAIDTVARLPWGGRVIEFMGHMRPARPLRRRLGAVEIDAPVGLAPGIDPRLLGLTGLCRFGFGFVEIGPVTVGPVPERRTVRDDVTETIGIAPPDASPGLVAVEAALGRIKTPRPAFIVRLAADGTQADDQVVIDALAAQAAAFSIPMPAGRGADVDAACVARVRRVMERARGVPCSSWCPRTPRRRRSAWSRRRGMRARSGRSSVGPSSRTAPRWGARGWTPPSRGRGGCVRHSAPRPA